MLAAAGVEIVNGVRAERKDLAIPLSAEMERPIP